MMIKFIKILLIPVLYIYFLWYWVSIDLTVKNKIDNSVEQLNVEKLFSVLDTITNNYKNNSTYLWATDVLEYFDNKVRSTIYKKINDPFISKSTWKNYYVSNTGSDSYPGSQSYPFSSIAKASEIAEPWDTIHVMPWTYNWGFKTLTSWTNSSPITYISEVKWWAKIVPADYSNYDIAWDNRWDYINIIWFEIDWTNQKDWVPWTIWIYLAWSYSVASSNLVHNIATNVEPNNIGWWWIASDSYFYWKWNDILNNIIHDIWPKKEWWHWYHTIYVSTSWSVKNNIVYWASWWGIHLWHDASNVDISNNTVFWNWIWILIWGWDYYHLDWPCDYITVNNNIVYDNDSGVSEEWDTWIHNKFTNNLIYKNTDKNIVLKNWLEDIGTIKSDPWFVRYDRYWNWNYKINNSSLWFTLGATKFDY